MRSARLSGAPSSLDGLTTLARAGGLPGPARTSAIIVLTCCAVSLTTGIWPIRGMRCVRTIYS